MQVVQINKIIVYVIRSGEGLTWHGGVIPSNELWLKLGDGKGHGNFKLNIQLVNTCNPNSMKNTRAISVFKAGDSTANLHNIALKMYEDHVKEAHKECRSSMKKQQQDFLCFALSFT